MLGLAHLTHVQEAFQEGKLGLDVGKNVPATRRLSVLRGSEFPVRAGMQAELSGVMKMEAQRPKIWDCVTLKLMKTDFCLRVPLVQTPGDTKCP